MVKLKTFLFFFEAGLALGAVIGLIYLSYTYIIPWLVRLLPTRFFISKL